MVTVTDGGTADLVRSTVDGSVPACRIVLASDVRLYRDGLALALSGLGLTTVGVAGDTQETIQQVVLHRPDALLLDWGLSGVSDAVRAAMGECRQLRVVVFAVPDKDQYVLGLTEAGIAGYVTREASIGDLRATIEHAMRGEFWCPPRTVACFARQLASVSRNLAARRTLVLTARESEIARHLQAGRSNKEIARALGIELPTVKNHVHKILEKLHLERRAEVRIALRDSD